MSQKLWLVTISVVLVILLAAMILVPHPQDPASILDNSDYIRNGTTKIPLTTPIVPADTGRPCMTNEEWHQKSDRIGAWIDGALIDPSISDPEILTLMSGYNISQSRVRIFSPHFIGYYMIVPEPQYHQDMEMIESNQTTTNLSFSSPMYSFTIPIKKLQNNSVLVPVMVAYTSQMNETITYQDLVNRDIPVRESKVIEIDLRTTLSPSDREQLLLDLSRDRRVLFTYKAYLEGVLC